MVSPNLILFFFLLNSYLVGISQKSEINSKDFSYLHVRSDKDYGLCTFSDYTVLDYEFPANEVLDIQDFTDTLLKFNAAKLLNAVATAGSMSLLDIINPAFIQRCQSCAECLYGCTYTAYLPAAEENVYKIEYSPEEIAKKAVFHKKKDIWILKFILFHEFLHALRRDPDRAIEFKDTQGGASERDANSASLTLKKRELAADVFAATWSGRLGSNLSQALMAVEIFGSKASFGYPAREVRLDSIKAGWTRGKNVFDGRAVPELQKFNVFVHGDVVRYNDELENPGLFEYNIRQKGGQQSINSKNKLILNEPFFFIKNGSLYFKNSKNKDITIGAINEFNHPLYKYYVMDGSATLWMIDKLDKVHNHRNIIIGRLYPVK